MKDYYYILGIAYGSSDDDLKKAYRKLSLKFHPDKNNGDKFFEERFKEINEAYETLSNQIQRKKYDIEYKKIFQEPEPEIILFSCNKESIYSGDEIIIEWEVKNATVIEIKPFGKVLQKGEKNYVINNINSKEFRIKLIAKNSSYNVSEVIVVENKLFGDFKSLIEADFKKRDETGKKQKTQELRKKEKIYTEMGVVLAIAFIGFWLIGIAQENPITFIIFGILMRFIVFVELTKASERLNRDKTFWGVFSFMLPIIALIVIGQLKPKVKH